MRNVGAITTDQIIRASQTRAWRDGKRDFIWQYENQNLQGCFCTRIRLGSFQSCGMCSAEVSVEYY
jgi:hypothetical protein